MTTKKDIIKQISEKTGLSQVETKQVVQGLFDSIVDILATDGRIELRNFGVFMVRTRAERKARNPRTGEEVIVPQRRIVTFKSGRKMQALIK